jgi:hypothetical protein
MSPGESAGIAGGIEHVTAGFVRLGQAASNAGQAASNAIGDLLKGVEKAAEKNGIATGLIINQLIGATDYYSKLASSADINFQKFTDQTSQLESGLNTLKEKLGAGKAGEILKGIGESFGFTGDNVMGFIKNVAFAADQVLYTQQGMLQAATSAGNMGEFYKRGSFDVDKMNASAVNLQNSLVNVTEATTRNHAQTLEMFGNFQKIPGAMQGITEGAHGSEQAMQRFTGMIQFATGTNQSFATVSDQVTYAVNNLGASFDDAMGYAARLSQVSRDLGIPLGIAGERMKDLTNTFAVWGNTTEGSAQIFGNLYESFKQTGLGAEQATKIIVDMTKSMHSLGIAKEALISGRTGGPGGLQGAFQIEQLISEGKTDQVLKKMQQSLRQAMGGGKIIDLKEAGTSQAAAGQYAKQRAILASDAFGGFGKDEATANKILQVMSKGGDLSSKDLGDVKNVLKDTKKDGENQQAQTNNILSNILMSVVALKVGSYEEAAKVARRVSEPKAGVSALTTSRKQAEERSNIAGRRPLSAKSETKYKDDFSRGAGLMEQGSEVRAKVSKGIRSLLGDYLEGKEPPPNFKNKGTNPVGASAEKVVQNAAAAEKATAAAATVAKGQAKTNTATIPINIIMPPCPHCGKTNHSQKSNAVIPINPSDIGPGF